MKTLIILLMVIVALGIGIKWVVATQKQNSTANGVGGTGTEVDGPKPIDGNQTT